MDSEGPETSVAPPAEAEPSGNGLFRRPPSLGLPLDADLDEVPPFPGPDLVVDSHRFSLFWPGLTVLLAAGSVVLIPIILGPVAIISGLIAVSRAERFARIALALAVICMLAGFLVGALVLHHHHGSLISKVTFL